MFAQDEDLIAVRAVPMSSPASRQAVTGATVRGRVLYADTSRPVRFAGVNLLREETRTVGTGNGSGNGIGGGTINYGRMSNAKTDENGEFVIKNVEPGTYSVEMTAAGFLTKSSFGRGLGTNPKLLDEYFEKFDVAGMGEIQILVRATRAGSISGRITYADGEVAVGLRVEALRKANSMFNSDMSNIYGQGFTTDDRGQYRITGLAPGEYVVRVIEPYRHNEDPPPYFSQMPESTTLRTYYPEGERADEAKTVTVNLGEESPGIDISVPERRLFEVSGTVISKITRQPLEGFSVRFASMNPQDRNVREFGSVGNEVASSDSGSWKLMNIPKGKYVLIVTERPRYDRNPAEAPKVRYGNARKEIEITDKNLDGIEIEVGAESSVSGNVVDEKGNPFDSNMGILLIDEVGRRSAFPEFRYRRQSAEKGAVDSSIRFAKVEPGRYRVFTGTQQYYIVSATLNGANVLSDTFEVREGEDVKGLTIVVSTAMGTVKGRVADFDGTPGYRAQLVRPGSRFEAIPGSTSLVAANGEFTIRAAPGSYQIVLFPPQSQMPRDAEGAKRFLEDLMRSAVSVTLTAGQNSTVTLQKP